MALDNFIPTIWSTELLVSLKKRLVFGQPLVVNRDYEGEIRGAGDTVKINSIGAVTVSNYTRNSDISAPQELTSAQTFLTIDQQKYFNFQIDDVDRAQMTPDVMAQAMRESAYAMANVADQFIASTLVGATSTNNMNGTIASPLTIAAFTDAYNNLVDLATMLDQANVPTEGRWAIVPPWYHNLMLKDDRFTRAPISSPLTDVIINGQVGEVAGLTILKSNNVPNQANGSGSGGLGTGCTYQIIAGTNMAGSYAEQVSQVEAYRLPLRFSDAIKGLHVYGAKTVRPEALAVLTINRN